jgi:hypothetical protein
MNEQKFNFIVKKYIQEVLNEDFSGASQITHNPDLKEKKCNCGSQCKCQLENASSKEAINRAFSVSLSKYKEALKKGYVPPSRIRKLQLLQYQLDRMLKKPGINESINEEASMAAGELDAIAHYVNHLKQLVNDDSNLEDWQKSKITLAKSNLESVFSSLNHSVNKPVGNSSNKQYNPSDLEDTESK